MSSIHRIRLIEPKAPGHHFFDYAKLPRLGLPLMGALLKQHGYDVRIYCEDIAPIDHADLRTADLVGISITTSTAPEGYRIADSLRKIGIPVVIGGPHATFMPEEALEHGDFCVRHEGDHILLQLIESLRDGDDPSGVPGLSYRSGGEVRHNEKPPLIDDLDSLPLPDLGLIHRSERIKVKPVLTSRGCPFDCIFCSVTGMFGKGFRFRSVESVIEELKQYRGKEVFFYDDNLAVNRARVKHLCEEIIRQDLRINWSAQVRTDVADDDEILRLFQKSGCRRLYIGLESINPETLLALKKKQDIGHIEKCIRKLREHRIMLHGMFISGGDHDSDRIVGETALFALKKGIDTIQFSVLTPLPGSKLYDTMEKAGRILTRDWSLYDGMHVVFEPVKMSAYTLHCETMRAWRRFYSLPQVMKLFLRFKFIGGILRFYGHRQIRVFESTNVGFVKWVRSLGDSAKEMSHITGHTCE